MSDQNKPSTLQSIVDQAGGAIQSVVGNLTGSTGDHAQGEAKKEKAQAEYDASQAAVKGPGFTASSSGAVTKDDPDRAAGSWNQTAGAAKETIGGIVGSESLKQQGREQNLQGQEQEAKGQLSDFASGVGDRVTGTIGSAAAGLTGNTGAQAEYQKQHDAGKTTQRGAEHDIQKQAEAQK